MQPLPYRHYLAVDDHGGVSISSEIRATVLPGTQNEYESGTFGEEEQP
jgi:hypothetical protein